MILERATSSEYRKLMTSLDMVDQIAFTLPVFPVPLSGCFKNVRGNGRADTDRYKDFKSDVDSYLAKHFSHHLGTPHRPTCATLVKVEYALERPDRRQRDLDNLLKALNDTLVRNHILGDDSQIVDLRIFWQAPWIMPEPVHVVIEPVS